MGSIVGYYFLKWAEHNVGPKWIDEHIHAYINIGGSLLGSTKGLSTLFSGEMKDTSQFYALQSYFVDTFMSPDDRLSLARSWGSVISLLPKGNEDIWGDLKSSPEESGNVGSDGGLGTMFSIKEKDGTWNNYTASQSIQKLILSLKNSNDEGYQKLAQNFENWYSFGISKPSTGYNKLDEKVYQANDQTEQKFIMQEPKYWSNPLESPLPYAPNMKIYCMYGIGKKN